MGRSDSLVSERLAETLAEAREPGDDDDGAGDGDGADDEGAAESETTPSVPPADEQPSAELVAKQLDKEMVRHEKALRRILEIDEPLRDAPYEGVIGFLLPGLNVMQPNEKYKACPTCAGMGDVLTGSFKPGSEVAPCPKCAGRGFLEKVERVAAPQGPVGEHAAGNGSEDEYGTPSWLGDPNLTPQV